MSIIQRSRGTRLVPDGKSCYKWKPKLKKTNALQLVFLLWNFQHTEYSGPLQTTVYRTVTQRLCYYKLYARCWLENCNCCKWNQKIASAHTFLDCKRQICIYRLNFSSLLWLMTKHDFLQWCQFKRSNVIIPFTNSKKIQANTINMISGIKMIFFGGFLWS